MGCCPCGGGEGCGSTCDKYCPCISMYPSLCTAFFSLVVAAVIAAAFGGYAYVSLRTSIFRFNWNTTWLVIINAALLAVICTGLLMLLSLMLWFVCSTEKRGLIFKGFFVFLLLLVVAAFAIVMAGAVLVIYGASKKDSAFASELEVAWVDLVNDPESTLACRVQKQLSCRGFESTDCLQDSPNANFTRCATVCRPEDEEDGEAKFGILIFPGCRERMSMFYTKWNAVLLAGASAACVLSLVALFVTCSSIAFEADK